MRWTTLILLFTYLQCFSQNVAYDSLYNKISKELLASRPVKALVDTEQLYELSSSETEKVGALLLRASILRQHGLKNEAIKVVVKAENIASKSGEHFCIARSNGLLSTLYRESGINWSGKRALNKAIEASRKIEDTDYSFRFQANLQQELAYYAMAEGNHVKAVSYLHNGLRLFNEIGIDSTMRFHLSVTNELIGKNYLRLRNTDSAFFYFQKARDDMLNSTYHKSPLSGFIYNGLGEAYMLKGDYSNAYRHLEKALDIAETSNFYNLKVEVYKTFQDYYKALNDNENYVLYNEKREELTLMEEQNRKEIANQLLQTLEEKQQEIQKNHRNNLIVLVALSLLTFFLMLSTILFRKKKKRKNIQKRTRNINKIAIGADKPKDCKDRRFIPSETEDYILGKLEEFESSKEFLDKGTSLTTLAAKIEINTRYLSYVIKEHKQTDFTTYINELRISHIVDRLKKNPDYLQYKISYLADICGFASHARFSVTFKKITGVAPSEFIEDLKDNSRNKIEAQ